MSLNAAPGMSKHGVSWVGRACLAAAASTLCRPGCCFRAACAGLVREAHGCRLRCYAGHGLSAGAQWVSMLSSAWGAGGLARAERGATPWYAPPCSGGAALARGDMGCSAEHATPAAWQTRWRLGARVFVQTRAGDSRGQLGVQPGCWREPRGAAACRPPAACYQSRIWRVAGRAVAVSSWTCGGAVAHRRLTAGRCHGGLPAGGAPTAALHRADALGPFMRQSRWQAASVVRLEAPAAVVSPAPVSPMLRCV